MTLTKIIVTLEGQEEVELTADEIAQYNAQQIIGAAQLAAEIWNSYQAQAQDLLDKSDVTIARCTENAVTVPDEWKSFRVALRAIISAPSGDPTQPLPIRPTYPVGT